jgi:hypothetical protein
MIVALIAQIVTMMRAALAAGALAAMAVMLDFLRKARLCAEQGGEGAARPVSISTLTLIPARSSDTSCPSRR